MKTKTFLAVGTVLLVLSVGGLRTYGAYQTETLNAAHRATIARMEAEAQDSRAAKLHLDYQQQTLADDRLFQAELRSASSPQAVLEVPLGPRAGTMDIEIASEKCTDAAIALKFYAELEGRYSTNRKLQTKVIAHKVWSTIIGSPADSQEQWFQFLATHETDGKGKLL